MLLNDSDRKIIAAALGWCALEYTRLAQVADRQRQRANAAKHTAIAGECARLADAFQPNAGRMMLTAGDKMAIAATLKTAGAEFNIRAIEADLKQHYAEARDAADFAFQCDRLEQLFKKPH